MVEGECVVLVHGMWMGPWAMSWLSHALHTAGYATRSISLHSMEDSPETHISRLADEVAHIDSPRINLLGHSMGGVIILHYLRQAREARVGRALLLGSPALGSEAARQLDRQPWGGILGASRELWRSEFLTRVPPGIEVGALAGDHAVGLGSIFASLEGPSDGAVTVAETRISGLRDHIVLPVSHSGMLFSAEVARQVVAFLKSGKFDR